ncbi:PUA-like domain-containing protein [Mycena galopus ATCC 62051]|nr:PUA-like domain-containing protein [Mycena galopus ATCC 62051]
MGFEEIRRRLLQDQTFYPATVLDESGSNLRIDARHGQPKSVPVGTSWETRLQCSEAGVHKPTLAGIHGCKDGAFSIVMAGGYEDATDDGDTLCVLRLSFLCKNCVEIFSVYIGTGGKGGDSGYGSPGPQEKDQSMDHPHNKSLCKSLANGRHVRVIRGPNDASPWAPLKGYRYDGMYSITEAWEDKGQRGYKVCKFRFVRDPGQPPLVRRSDAMPKRTAMSKRTAMPQRTAMLKRMTTKRTTTK